MELGSASTGLGHGIRAILLGMAIVPAIVACGGPASSKTSANLTPLLRDKDQPIEVRIQNIEKDPNIPAPEKDRMVGILKAEAASQTRS